MKKLNNKGFTLVELLAVLVILIAIMGIAIPTISSSLERTKAKQNEAKYKILESAAEQYVTDNKNTIYNTLDIRGRNACKLDLIKLSEYLSSEDMKDADGGLFSGVIVFERPNRYYYTEDPSVMPNTNMIPCE